MKVGDTMTHAVAAAPPNASIMDAMRSMFDQRISGLPVVNDSDRFAGILTEGDLLRRAETGTGRSWPWWLQFLHGPARQAPDHAGTHGRKAMIGKEVPTTTEAPPLDEAIELVESGHVKRILVVKDGQLIGVPGRADLLRALVQERCEILPAALPGPASWEQVVAELRQQARGEHRHVTVAVTNGVMYLETSSAPDAADTRLGPLAESAARMTEGRNHLDYFDPSIGLTYGF